MSIHGRWLKFGHFLERHLYKLLQAASMIYLLHFKVMHTRRAHQNHSVKDTEDEFTQSYKPKTREMPNICFCVPIPLCRNFQSHAWQEAVPRILCKCLIIHLLLSLLSPLLHLSSTGGANPLQTGILILLQHKPTCLRHTMQVSNSPRQSDTLTLFNFKPSEFKALSL